MDRMDEKLSMEHGKEAKKAQSFKDRRDESMGSKKPMKAKEGIKNKMGHKGK